MSPLESHRAVLVTKLSDALALYDEPVWQELRTALTTEEPAPQPREVQAPKEWYKAHPERLAKEQAVLNKLVTPVPDCPTLFFHSPTTDRLGATGLVRMTGGMRVKIEIHFPNDYPTSPPRVFFFGPALNKVPQLLREDGSVPVPFGSCQQWTENCTSGMVLNWAIEWLEQTMKLEATPPPANVPNSGRRRS